MLWSAHSTQSDINNFVNTGLEVGEAKEGREFVFACCVLAQNNKVDGNEHLKVAITGKREEESYLLTYNNTIYFCNPSSF